MPIVPNGSPAWTRLAVHTAYGGHVNKRNYLSRGVIDALTDVGAEALCRLAADLEAVVRTCPFATITYLTRDASAAAPTIETAYLMTGIRTTSYEGGGAPSGFPSAARNGNGDVTFTFASSYSDPYSVSGAFVPKHVGVSVGGTTAGEGVWEISGQTVRVRLFNGGSALLDRRATLEVW